MIGEEEFEKQRLSEGHVYWKSQNDSWVYFAHLTNGIIITFAEAVQRGEWVDLVLVDTKDCNREFMSCRQIVSVRKDHIVCIAECVS